MSSRALRLCLPLALGLALPLVAATPAWAQQPAQGPQINRGPMQIVGLRAPDGDADAATALTNGFREAARAAGYQVPDSTPSFDQEFAMVGCSSTSPECLSLIAADIHATKFIYGTVGRIGRGRDAQLSVEVSLWDESTHREVHREAQTMPRATARPESLREMARQMFVAIGNRDMAAQQDALRAQAGETARQAEAERLRRDQEAAQARARDAEARLRTGTPIQRSHVLRYVGLGVLGLGVVVSGIGVWQWLESNSQAGDSLNGQGDLGGAWQRYDNFINQDRRLSVSDVCDRARSDAGTNPDAAQATSLCDNNSTSRTLAFALGFGGLALAGVGAALIIIDSLNTSSAAPAPAATPPPAARRSQLHFSPVLSPAYQGVNVGLTF